MADVFDQLEADYGSTGASVATSSPIAASTDIFDQLESQYGMPVSNKSEAGLILSDALKGVGSSLSLLDELNPIRPEPGNYNPFSFPPLFGLSEKMGLPVTKQEPLINEFNRVATAYDLTTPERPKTELGQLAGNMAENAAGAWFLGPAAALGSAVFGGTGGYLGETAFGEKGRVWGSLTGGLSPLGLSKLGIVKEIGESLGPTISQLPVLRELFRRVGVNPIESAVGRALTKSTTDLPEAEKALKEVSDFIGPQTQLDSLKTTAEIAGDSGLARAEDAVQNLLPTAPFANLAKEREAARAASVLGKLDESMTPYETSKGLEQVVSKSIAAVEEVEETAWKALPGEAQVVANHADDALKAQISDITLEGSIPLTGSASGLLKRFYSQSSKGPMSLDQIQALRRKALEVGRSAKGDLSEAGQLNRSVASALEQHLRTIIDDNVAAGIFSEDVANAWKTARAITAGKKDIFSVAGQGTRNLENLALKGQSLDNTTLLKEGLNSPDKLAAHIRAAAVGGQDVRPLYKQALLMELDNVPQTKWADLIAKKRNQWEQVFSKEELANIERNLSDIESQLNKARMVQAPGSNSLTNTRGNIQDVLKSEKGIAAFGVGARNASSLLGASGGATYGWEQGDSIPDSALKALFGAIVGGTLGRGAKGALTRASDTYDNLLVDALQNPRTALKVIEAAKPSELGKAIKRMTIGAGQSALSQGTGAGLSSLMKNVLGQKQSEIPSMDNNKTEEVIKESPIAEVELDAVRYVESSDGKYLTSPKGAKGEYQFMPATAKAYGVNPNDTDYTDDRRGARELLEDEFLALGDKLLAYAAYNAGRPAVLEAIKKAKSRNYDDVEQYLPEETRDYVQKIIAAIELKSKTTQA